MKQSFYDQIKKYKNGRGKLFKAIRNSKRSPHIYGWIKLDDKIYRLSGWTSDGKSWNITMKEFDESKIVEEVRDEIGTVEQPPVHLVEPRKEWVP